MRISQRFCNQLGRVLGAVFEFVDQVSFTGSTLFTLLSFLATSFKRALFALLSVVLFLFSEELSVLFFPLDVQFDQGCVFSSVGCDACLCLRDVDFVDKVKSCTPMIRNVSEVFGNAY